MMRTYLKENSYLHKIQHQENKKYWSFYLLTLWNNWATWSGSRCDVDRLIGAEGNRLVGVVIRVVREHLQNETQGGNGTESDTLAFRLWRTDGEHSPGSSWSPAESASTLCDENGNEEVMDEEVWREAELSVRGDLHALVLTVSTQIERWSVSEQDRDTILPWTVLWWSHICRPNDGKAPTQKDGYLGHSETLGPCIDRSMIRLLSPAYP